MAIAHLSQPMYQQREKHLQVDIFCFMVLHGSCKNAEKEGKRTVKQDRIQERICSVHKSELCELYGPVTRGS